MKNVVWGYLALLAMAIGAVVFGEPHGYDLWFFGLMLPTAIAGIALAYYERRDARNAARLSSQERDQWIAGLPERRRTRAIRFLKEYIN